jgi:hypothetical protein
MYFCVGRQTKAKPGLDNILRNAIKFTKAKLRSNNRTNDNT